MTGFISVVGFLALIILKPTLKYKALTETAVTSHQPDRGSLTR